ncbi:hypothetical protein FRACYDRAFT_238576 [Fragilariopsis cylindrus CCMP1102]|uniref:MYND-type domain-containing protein n=1 Tax=Fragilariopsis cylindrus CCMP1102 TaxID=635003 RepID=A0A1E7FK26_9STRA|nr:hypothetical protein FRACYDRAFT_238576 [Fragilariopsis cylindrus CCMP1102]|eukprot:OEU18143.1 hypothetical protein FRACYDRAFT_238576 [Fragilariopsis cylindrus CCMP1102]
MGKINRRRNTNKKTGTDAASALVSLYSASSGTNPCYHGSTADKFQPGSEYLKAVEEYFNTCRQGTLLNNQVADKFQPGCEYMKAVWEYLKTCHRLLDNQDGSQFLQAMQKMRYDVDHRHLMKDPEFSRFIFAFCTQQYLKSNNFKAGTPPPFIYILLTLGIRCRYSTATQIKEFDKYNRDAFTERGIINILFRETKTHCPCMNEAKAIAKTMDKEAICNGCNLIFPKETLRPCTGCQKVDYHNQKCQKKHWPTHRFDCKRFKIGMGLGLGICVLNSV